MPQPQLILHRVVLTMNVEIHLIFFYLCAIFYHAAKKKGRITFTFSSHADIDKLTVLTFANACPNGWGENANLLLTYLDSCLST